jgi:hypothetical protein
MTVYYGPLKSGYERFLPHPLHFISVIILPFNTTYGPVYSDLHVFVCLFVCFPGVTIHWGCIFQRPVAGFSLLVFEVSKLHTTTRHSR